MEDQKTQIVEKRLSKGVIRRRVRNEPQAPETAQATEVTPVKQETPVVVAKPETAPVVKKQSEKPISVQSEEKTQPAVVEAVPEKVTPVVTELPQPVAQDKSTLTTAPESSEKKVSPVVDDSHRMVTEIGKEVIKDSKKSEKDKPLSFKDRILGTISLDRFQPQKKTQPAQQNQNNTTQQRPQNPLNAPRIPDLLGDLNKEKEDSKKAAKSKKGVKLIGGDLDVEGLGRATTLTQLNRTLVADRVFRPDAQSRKKKIIPRKKVKSTVVIEKKASKRIVEMDQTITVGNLAQQLGVKAGEIIGKLMNLGLTLTINQSLDKDTAILIASEYQYEIKDTSFKEEALLEQVVSEEKNLEGLKPRPPIVTIMGHVDHGKTSLLDAIRSTNVTAGEAGGITQHIGAYTVTVKGQEITFLDTPGHEAFTAMRARGAKVTDIVVLVVAADDGLMPQTEESIAHARAAQVPIVVAINKVDKPDANPDKVLRELSEKGILAEEWGGDVQTVRVSAKAKTGIEQLLEGLLLQSEILELKANPEKRAKGIVIESELDKFKGPVSTFLIQEGTLKKGDVVVAGLSWGKVRAMTDWRGQSVGTAGPSHAVEILGLDSVPQASEIFNVVETEQDAKEVIANRIAQRKTDELANKDKVSLEDMFSKIKEGNVQEFNILLKTDVHGSLEAIRDALLKLGNAEIKTRILHAGVGGVKESDIQLALASKAAIIAFNVRPETNAIHLAKEKNVEIRQYKIIYELLDDVKKAMQGLLTPDKKETYLGRAEVRQVFTLSKAGVVAGSMVVDGKITRTANLRLLRDNVVIFEGKIATLKRFKDDQREVAQGFECGIGLEGCQDIKSGDVIEAFVIEEIQRTL